MTLRIAHLVSYPIYSGPLPPTLGLAKAQRALGHQVYLAYDTKRGAFNEYEEAAEPWLKDAGFDPPEAFTLSTKSSLSELLADGAKLRRLSSQIDILHLHLSHDHTMAALFLPRSFPGRVVRTIHAERSLNPRLGQRWLNKRANGWIVRSETHQSLLLNRFKPDPSAIRVISGSLDAESFQNIDIEMRKNARKRFQLPEDARVLAHVALIAGRGQEELVEAIAAMGDAAPHLLFVGRGENEDSLRALVHERGVENKVRFSGYLQGDDLLNAYAAADTAFVAQPGNDASARAVLEAMAAALPVLAVRTGSLVETVSHTRGYFIEEKTPKSIQSTIEKWLGDPEARQKGQIGREWVLSERSFVKEAEQVLSFYEYLYQNIPC